MTAGLRALGFVGAALLSACGLPLLFPDRRFGDRVFLLMWLWGEVALFWYVLGTSRDVALLLNYGFNSLLVVAVIVRRARAN